MSLRDVLHVAASLLAIEGAQACRTPERSPVDTPLFYEIEGSGPAVVFVNGTGLSHRMWNAQTEAFRRRHTVLRFDARGTGQALVPTEPFDTRQDLAELLEGLDLATIWLVGQSGGASFAIDFTLEYPELVDGLILGAPGVGGFTFPPEEFARFGRYATASANQGHSESIDLMLTDSYLETACEQRALAVKLREIYLANENMWNPDAIRFAQPLNPPAIGRLDEIQAPTLIIVGDRDLPHIQEISVLLHEDIAGSELVTIQEAGHLVNMENAEEFNRLALSFLRRHRN